MILEKFNAFILYEKLCNIMADLVFDAFLC